MARGPIVPDERHPITVEPAGVHVEVRHGDRVVAATDRALALREASYPVVYYVPREDVDATLLRDSATSTHCPYKGDASYVDLVTDDGVVSDAGWTYSQAYPSVEAITGHLAWYPNKVTVTTS